MGFDFSEWTDANEVDRLQLVPRLRWLRLEFASATRETAAPAEILDSYNDWTAWRDGVESVRTPNPPQSFPPAVLPAAARWQYSVSSDCWARARRCPQTRRPASVIPLDRGGGLTAARHRQCWLHRSQICVGDPAQRCVFLGSVP